MRSALIPAFVAFMTMACAASDVADDSASSTEPLKVLRALEASELKQPLTKQSIRALQPWVDDATFEAKWTSMLSAPIEFFGGAASAYHADLATLPAPRLPGDQALCHGDAKFDNFGWTRVEGHGVFSDNDFDDAGFCPVAADALRFLVATDLWFADAALNVAARDAYVATVFDASAAVPVDPASEPDWANVRAKGLAKATSGDHLTLGGEMQAATPAEESALRNLAASDSRFASNVLDVARVVRTEGGSAGLRRFWLLIGDSAGVSTILELKELTTPAVEFGHHAHTLDGPSRFDILKSFWWGSVDAEDHYLVYTLGSRFLVRDRLTRATPNDAKMTPTHVRDMVRAEASILALAHRHSWRRVTAQALTAWLGASADALSSRWRAAYVSAGGK